MRAIVFYPFRFHCERKEAMENPRPPTGQMATRKSC